MTLFLLSILLGLLNIPLALQEEELSGFFMGGGSVLCLWPHRDSETSFFPYFSVSGQRAPLLQGLEVFEHGWAELCAGCVGGLTE